MRLGDRIHPHESGDRSRTLPHRRHRQHRAGTSRRGHFAGYLLDGVPVYLMARPFLPAHLLYDGTGAVP
jgi:hypothetical protein